MVHLVGLGAPVQRRDDDAGELACPVQGRHLPAVLQQRDQVVAALQTPELRQKITEAGFSVSGTARADTDRMLRNESQRWAAIVKASGFKAN